MTEESVARKQAKEQLKNARSLERLKKIFYALFVCYVVLFVVKYAIKNDPANNRSIYDKVGAGGVAGNLGIKDSLILKELSIVRYKEYLENGDYESAYDMLSREYQDYVSYSDYITKVRSINPSTFDMKNVHPKSSLAYVADIIYKTNNDETVETTYMLYPNEYNPDNYKISPDGFLYVVRNQQFEKDNMIVNVDECIVFNDHISIKGSITNKEWFDDITLSNMAISYGKTLNVWCDFNRTIAKDGSMSFEESFNKTDYMIPNGIILERQRKNKDKTYWFEFVEPEKEDGKLTFSEIIDTLKS